MNYSFFRLLIITLIGFSFAECNQKGTFRDPGIDNKCIEDLTSSCLIDMNKIPAYTNSKPKFKWKITWTNSSGSYDSCYIEEPGNPPSKTYNIGDAETVNVYLFAVDKVSGIKSVNLSCSGYPTVTQNARPPNQNNEVSCDLIAIKVIERRLNRTALSFTVSGSAYDYKSNYSSSHYITLNGSPIRP